MALKTNLVLQKINCGVSLSQQLMKARLDLMGHPEPGEHLLQESVDFDPFSFQIKIPYKSSHNKENAWAHINELDCKLSVVHNGIAL